MTEAEELEQKLIKAEPWVRELVEALWFHQKELVTRIDELTKETWTLGTRATEAEEKLSEALKGQGT